LSDSINQSAAAVVAAYVSSQEGVTTADLLRLVRDVRAAFAELAEHDVLKKGLDSEGNKEPDDRPKIDPRMSVFDDKILCLKCNKPFQMLRRHLQTEHAMTPEQYRAAYRLPESYPMTAPNYSTVRSALAKASGLGLKKPPPAKAKRRA